MINTNHSPTMCVIITLRSGTPRNYISSLSLSLSISRWHSFTFCTNKEIKIAGLVRWYIILKAVVSFIRAWIPRPRCFTSSLLCLFRDDLLRIICFAIYSYSILSLLFKVEEKYLLTYHCLIDKSNKESKNKICLRETP